MSTQHRDTIALFAVGLIAMFLVLGGGTGLADAFGLLLDRVS